MNLSLYKIFVEVAKLGSFAALARKMNSDPSSISRQIAALEDQLGYRLFERSTRRLALTEAGQLTFDRIQNPIDEILDIQNLARDAVTQPQGTLRVGASVAFGERWLVPQLSGFKRLYHKITIELVLSDSTSDLISENIDLAIRLGDRPSGPYVSQRLMTTHYRLVASPDYLKTAGLPSKPADIKFHNCIAFPFPGFRSLWQFKSDSGVVEKIEFEPSMIISNALAIRQAALQNMGIALLSDWTIKDELANGQLVDIFPELAVSAKDFDTCAWLLYPSRSYVPAKTRALITHLKGFRHE